MHLGKLTIQFLACWLLVIAFPSYPADKVRFQLDWLPGGDKAPVYVGVQAGFFADEGLEVSIATGRGSTDALTRLATGIADIGLSDISALMVARAQEDIGVSALMSVFSQAPHAFFTLEESGVTAVSQVAGRRIATSAFTSSNVFLPLLLQRNRVAEDTISLIKADAGTLGPMLLTGSADLVISWVTDREKFVAQGAQMGRKVLMLPWYEAGMDVYATSLVANDEFLAQQPGVARRFMRAYLRSIEFTWQHPDRAAAMVNTMVPEVDADIAEATIRSIRSLVYNQASNQLGIGAFDRERLLETWSWTSTAQGLGLASFDPERVVNRELMSGIVPLSSQVPE